MNTSTYIKLFLTAVFWGGTFIAGRIVARNIDPFSAAFLRFFIASLFLITITLKMEGRFPALSRGQILPVFLLGMTGIFTYNVLFFKGLHFITAGRASLIIANNPIFISLFSALVFREKLTPLKIIGILISVSGAVVVISRGQISQIISQGFGRGELYILLCVASWVAYSLIGKSVMVKLSPLVSVTYSSIIGSAALLVPALYHGMAGNLLSFSPAEWSSLFYLAFFGTVLGFLWYYQGIKKIGPMRASIFINFVPISAILMAYLILDEPVTHSLLIGAIMVISGVYFTNVSTFRNIPRPAFSKLKIPGRTEKKKLSK